MPFPPDPILFRQASSIWVMPSAFRWAFSLTESSGNTLTHIPRGVSWSLGDSKFDGELTVLQCWFCFLFLSFFLLENNFSFSYNRIYSDHRFHSPASPISFLPLLPSIQFHVFFLFLSLVNKEAKKNGKQSCSHQWELLMELQRVKIHCMTKSNWRPPRLPWSIPSHPSAHFSTLLSCWSVSSVYFKSPVAGTLYFPVPHSQNLLMVGELGRHVTGDRCGLPRQVSLVPHLRSWPISSSSVRLITLIFTHRAYHHWYYCFIYLVLFSRLLSVVSSTAAPSAMKRTSFRSYSDLLQA